MPLGLGLGISKIKSLVSGLRVRFQGNATITAALDGILRELSADFVSNGTVTAALEAIKLLDVDFSGDGTLTADLADLDPDYQAVLDYATLQGYILPSETVKTAQNNFFLDLKSFSLFSKLDSFSIFASDGDSSFALVDMKKLITKTAVNSPTFDSNIGFTGNGTSSYIDFNFSPANSGNYAISNSSVGVYYGNVLTRENNGIGLGLRQSTNNNSTSVSPYNATEALLGVNNDLGFDLENYTKENGLFVVCRDNPTNYNFYLNGVLASNIIISEDSFLSTSNFFAFAFNTGSSAVRFSNDLIKFVFTGQSLNEIDNINLNIAFNNYLNSL